MTPALLHISIFPLTQPVLIFTVVLLIILCTPALFARLKIPNIVGMILAGVAVGPYGFNILANDASFEVFGQVGILYLMFLAAVEIDMYHLRLNYKPGLLFGLVTFLLPMAVGIPLTHYALGTGWTGAVLISSMYASHTLVSYPIVSRFGLSNNRGAVIAVCGTIVAVLLALLTLAEVISVRTLGSFSPARLSWLVVMMAVYAAGIGWLFPRLTRWYFRKTSDTVMQFIFILALVCVASILAKVIGLEAILGAFYAGLVLNRFIPARSGLIRRISFAGNAIFIPYFLIGVGMLINVHVVFKGWAVVTAALIMSATALGTKLVAALGTGRAAAMPWRECFMMYGLTSGKAAATIAATIVGFEYGLLSEDLMNAAVMMILLCCIVASVVTERSAKRIRITLTAEELNTEAPRQVEFARQVVAVSNPLTAEGITQMSLYMRNPRNTNPVTVLYVRNNDNLNQIRDGRRSLQLAHAAVEGFDLDCREVERYDLNIMAGVTNTMRQYHATEVAVGLHRRSNIVDTFFGSLLEQLIKSTDRMIIISRCFMPVDTIRKMVVYVPENAEYETGFSIWIARLAHMATQLAMPVVFLTYSETAKYLEANIAEGRYEFRREFKRLDTWDDFIIYSRQIEAEDLLMIIGARKGSVSYTGDSGNMSSFVARNFSANNIAMIIPSQFGEGA